LNLESKIFGLNHNVILHNSYLTELIVQYVRW